MKTKPGAYIAGLLVIGFVLLAAYVIHIESYKEAGCTIDSDCVWCGKELYSENARCVLKDRCTEEVNSSIACKCVDGRCIRKLSPIFGIDFLMKIKGILLLILLGGIYFLIYNIWKNEKKDEHSWRYIFLTAIGGGVIVSLVMTGLSLIDYLLTGHYWVPWLYTGGDPITDKYLVVETIQAGYIPSYINMRWDLDVAILFTTGFSLLFAILLSIVSRTKIKDKHEESTSN